MTNTDIHTPEITKVASIADIQNAIECHYKIAKYLDIASRLHTEAAKHHQNGHHEKAAQCILKAHGNLILAGDLQRENLINHAIISTYL